MQQMQQIKCPVIPSTWRNIDECVQIKNTTQIICCLCLVFKTGGTKYMYYVSYYVISQMILLSSLAGYKSSMSS